MNIDLRGVFVQTLRWLTAVLLLTLAWQTIVDAGAETPAPQSADAPEQAPEPKKAPPGPIDDFNRGVPRTSVEGYIKALRETDYERAAEYLDLRNLQQGLSASDGPLLARQLGVVLDRTLWIEVDLLSENPEGHADDGLPAYRDYVDSLEADGDRVDILLQRVPRGDGVSIWKFSNATVRQIPDLYDRYGYGPVAEQLLQVLPEGKFLGFHVWQWALVVVFIGGAWLASIILSRLIALLPRLRGRRLGEHAVSFLNGPIRFLIALLILRNWIDAIHPPAVIRAAMKGRTFLVLIMSWVLVRFIDILREHWSQKLREAGREQAIVLLQPLTTAGKVVVIIGAVVLWLDNIGVEVTTLVTGLGLGGVAFALAAQKSVEDIFGAVTLFTAAPVRVGDFCRFGNRIGTVEEIGLRVTLIRTLDRTVVSVPNAQFAAMELENYAAREKFRYAPRLRLRYGTSPDQVRYIIVKVQELFHAHPKVIPPPAKTRFTNFGEHSLEFDVFTYIDASSFDDFQEVAEDLNLRVMDIVREAGTGFAVPEQKLHIDRAPKPDEDAARAAEAQVARWRETNELPLPHPSQERLGEISNTLEYPPEGAAGKE
jgi:MscS family membrane protein